MLDDVLMRDFLLGDVLIVSIGDVFSVVMVGDTSIDIGGIGN